MGRPSGPAGASGVARRSLAAGLAALAVSTLSTLSTGSAWAQAPASFRVGVLVCQAADGPGGIDAACEKLHASIGKEFRYGSLARLQSQQLSLALDQVGELTLPNGKSLKVRPLQADAGSALLAVDVEGAVQTDVRVRNGQLVVIGAQRHQDGKLVIALEPSW
jgi:hypothetical protein